MHRRTLLALLVMAFALVGTSPAMAQQPPYPESLDGNFQIRHWRVGDAGVYMESMAQDIGEGFQEVSSPHLLARFELLGRQKVNTASATAVPVWAMRLNHTGFIWNRDDTRTERLEDVHIGLDGSASIGMVDYKAGSFGTDGVMERTYMGRWGSLPCGMRLPFQGSALDLTAPSPHGLMQPWSCSIRGQNFGSTAQPVARMALGPVDTVVFHEARDGTRRGETWTWFATDYPAPIAMVVQDGLRPTVFHVYRLTNFLAGSGEEVRWSTAGPGTPWPILETAPMDAKVPMTPTWAPLGVAQVLDIANNSTQGPDLSSWMNENDPVLVQAELGGTFTGERDNRVTIAASLHYRTATATARIHVTRTIDPGMLAQAGVDPFPIRGQPTPSQLDNATTDTVYIAIGDCQCSPLPANVRSVRLPTGDSLLERWQALRGGDYAQSSPNHFAFDRSRCDDSTCQHASLEATVGRSYWNQQGNNFDLQVSSLEYRVNSSPSHPDAAMTLLEARKPTPAPSPKVPLLHGLLGSTGILEALRDQGLLQDHPPAPVPHDPGLPSTGIDHPRALPSDAKPVAATAMPFVPVVGTTAAALSLAALLWFLVKSTTVAALFSRIRGSRLLDNPVRAQLHDLVEGSPGIHFSALVRASGRGKTVVRHHLEKLVQGGLVHATSGKGHTTYTVRGALDARLRQVSPALASTVRRRVLKAVITAPNSTMSSLANRLGLDPTTVAYHVGQLRAAGLVEARRAGAGLALNATGLGTQAMRSVVQGEA